MVRQIERAERETAGGEALQLRIAVDYSARDAAVRAAGRLAGADGAISIDAFERALAAETHSEPDMPPIDLLIRTGGELRVSDQ